MLRADSLLADPLIRAALRQAWRDSRPGETGRHEEGGFVVRDENGILGVVRWPVGSQNEILVPVHADCRVADQTIVASFHTHPNTGADFLQESSDTDISAVRDDPNLKARDYQGEFVISHALVYHITPSGQVSEAASTPDLLDPALS